MLVALVPFIAIAGCSKRQGITYPVTTPGITASRTNTPVIINTSTFTKTATRTPVYTSTATKTNTQVVVNSSTSTATVTETSTGISTATSTATATQTATNIAAAMATAIGGIAQPTVALGTSARFAVMSNQDLTNIPSSSIFGDVGISPGLRSNIVALIDGDGQVDGTHAIYAADDLTPPGVAAMLIQAYDDAVAAYGDAVNASRGTPTSISGDINGLTLAPGLYESGSSIEISPGGKLYLDGLGDLNAVWVIRSATSITTESTSEVILAGGAQAKNIFWVAGSTITLGTNSIMKGTLIASSSISLLNMADLNGRAIIQSAAAGQISLSQNIIVLP